MKRGESSRITNAFGTYWITFWPAMGPEAPHPQYTAQWVTADGRFHARPQPTMREAHALIPISNGAT